MTSFSVLLTVLGWGGLLLVPLVILLRNGRSWREKFHVVAALSPVILIGAVCGGGLGFASSGQVGMMGLGTMAAVCATFAVLLLANERLSR